MLESEDKMDTSMKSSRSSMGMFFKKLGGMSSKNLK